MSLPWNSGSCGHSWSYLLMGLKLLDFCLHCLSHDIPTVSVFPYYKDANKRIMDHPFLNFTGMETLYFQVRPHAGLWLSMAIERTLFDALFDPLQGLFHKQCCFACPVQNSTWEGSVLGKSWLTLNVQMSCEEKNY